MVGISSISDPSGAPQLATTESLLIFPPQVTGLQKKIFFNYKYQVKTSLLSTWLMDI